MQGSPCQRCPSVLTGLQWICLTNEPDERNALGAFVADKLKALGMRPTEFAERTGLGRTTVYELLEDRPPSKLSTQQLRAMADILGVTTDDIVDLANGTVSEIEARDMVGELIRGFVISHADLTPEQLQQALVVASAAARLARPSPIVAPKARRADEP